MKRLSILLVTCLALVAGGAAAQSNEVEPSAAFKALVGTDLEVLVRHHAILSSVCADSSLNDQLSARSMLLHVRLLGSELKDVRASEELTWLTNAYFVAYAAGMEPMVGMLEEKSPGFRAQLCRITRENAVTLLKD